MWSRQYVHSYFSWAHEAANAMLVFDTREMKFSIADLPRKSNGKFKMKAVEAGDGRLGLLLLSNGSRSTTVDLYSKASRNRKSGSGSTTVQSQFVAFI